MIPCDYSKWAKVIKHQEEEVQEDFTSMWLRAYIHANCLIQMLPAVGTNEQGLCGPCLPGACKLVGEVRIDCADVRGSQRRESMGGSSCGLEWSGKVSLN